MNLNTGLDHQSVYNDKHRTEASIINALEELMKGRWSMYMLKGVDVEVMFNLEDNTPNVSVRIRMEVR